MYDGVSEQGKNLSLTLHNLASEDNNEKAHFVAQLMDTHTHQFVVLCYTGCLKKNSKSFKITHANFSVRIWMPNHSVWTHD